jgi:hypothetical protein
MEAMTMYLALVEELCLVGSSEASHPKLALWEVGKKLATEGHYRRAQEVPFGSKAEAVQDFGGLSPGGFRKSPRLNTEARGPQNLILVQVLNLVAFGPLILPAMPGMYSIEQQLLVARLRHQGDGRTQALIGATFEDKWNEIGPRLSFEYD